MIPINLLQVGVVMEVNETVNISKLYIQKGGYQGDLKSNLVR